MHIYYDEIETVIKSMILYYVYEFNNNNNNSLMMMMMNELITLFTECQHIGLNPPNIYAIEQRTIRKCCFLSISWSL